jgi:hypothetical protein
MGRTTRTQIPGLPGVVLTATQQQGSTTFALDVTRDDCVDFTLDLSGNDCEVVDAEGALHLRSIASKGTTALGTAVGTTLRPRFEYAVHQLRPRSPQTVVEDVVEQGRHDNCWLLASLIAVGPCSRMCLGGLWATTTLAPDRALAGATRRGHAHDALSVLTGCPVDVLRSGERDAEALWSFVAEAVRRKDPVVVSTRRVDDTSLAPGHAYALMDCRSLNGERYCRLRDPRGGLPATDAGAALAGDAPLARGERWVPFSELFAAHAAVSLARLSSPRGAPWRVARARAALAGGGPTAALRVECDRATLLRCAAHQEEDLTDLGVAVLDLSTDAIVAATVAGKARTADVDVTVGPGVYAVIPTGGRFLPEDGRQNVGLVVHADIAVKASAAPATAADLAGVLFAGVTHQLDGPGRLVVAQSRGGVDVVVENTDTRTLDLRLDGTGSTNLEGHAGAMTVAVSVEPGAAAHVLSAAPVQAHAAWTWDAVWCASWS